MRPIIVIRIEDFPGIISEVGIIQAVDMIYQMREIGHRIFGQYLIRECDDQIVAVLDEGEDVDLAIEMAQDMISFCTEHLNSSSTSHIPLIISIGFGSLYETSDGDFWGNEIYVAQDLLRQGSQGQIILTPAAVIEHNTTNELEIDIDPEKAELVNVGISHKVDDSETDMVTITGERNWRK